MKSRVYLSRRNLLTLLSKLDRRVAGQQTWCTLVKNDNAQSKFRQSMKSIEVTAVEDYEYYTQRDPGPVHDDDTPGRELALAVLKLHGREYLDDREYATVEGFLSKYGLKWGADPTQ